MLNKLSLCPFFWCETLTKVGEGNPTFPLVHLFIWTGLVCPSFTNPLNYMSAWSFRGLFILGDLLPDIIFFWCPCKKDSNLNILSSDTWLLSASVSFLLLVSLAYLPNFIFSSSYFFPGVSTTTSCILPILYSPHLIVVWLYFLTRSTTPVLHRSDTPLQILHPPLSSVLVFCHIPLLCLIWDQFYPIFGSWHYKIIYLLFPVHFEDCQVFYPFVVWFWSG